MKECTICGVVIMCERDRLGIGGEIGERLKGQEW